jgi:hypothetical protein
MQKMQNRRKEESKVAPEVAPAPTNAEQEATPSVAAIPSASTPSGIKKKKPKKKR